MTLMTTSTMVVQSMTAISDTQAMRRLRRYLRMSVEFVQVDGEGSPVGDVGCWFGRQRLWPATSSPVQVRVQPATLFPIIPEAAGGRPCRTAAPLRLSIRPAPRAGSLRRRRQEGCIHEEMFRHFDHLIPPLVLAAAWLVEETHRTGKGCAAGINGGFLGPIPRLHRLHPRR